MDTLPSTRRLRNARSRVRIVANFVVKLCCRKHMAGGAQNARACICEVHERGSMGIHVPQSVCAIQRSTCAQASPARYFFSELGAQTRPVDASRGRSRSGSIEVAGSQLQSRRSRRHISGSLPLRTTSGRVHIAGFRPCRRPRPNRSRGHLAGNSAQWRSSASKFYLDFGKEGPDSATAAPSES